MGCGCAGGSSLTGVGPTSNASGCSNDCSALRILNSELPQAGLLRDSCQLFFETPIFLYRVTFNGNQRYQIAREEKGTIGYDVIGTGMTITQAANAIPLYGPFIGPVV